MPLSKDKVTLDKMSFVSGSVRTFLNLKNNTAYFVNEFAKNKY